MLMFWYDGFKMVFKFLYFMIRCEQTYSKLQVPCQNKYTGESVY